MVLPLIVILLGAAAALTAVVVLVILYWNQIVDWFREREALKAQDKDNIAFTLQQKLSSGAYETVQGIFNTRINMPVEGEIRKIRSEDIDDQVKATHRRQELALYE